MKKEKITHFTVRVEDDLKKRFSAVAKANDSDASKEVRKFIKEYLAKYSQQKISF